jgi:hypothetical protein
VSSEIHKSEEQLYSAAPQSKKKQSYETKRDVSHENSHYLKLSEGTLPLIFEDNDYSKELKDEIVADLNRVYSRFKKHRIFPKPATTSFEIDGHIVESNEYVDFSVNDFYFVPRVIRINFADLIEINNTKHIVISKKLMGFYKEALHARKGLKEKFVQLNDFIDYVNSLDDSSSLSDEEVRELFVIFANNIFYDTEMMKIKRINSYLNERFNYRIRKPSLLNFEIINKGDDSVLCYRLIRIKKDDNSEGETAFCYVESRWRMVIPYN